MNGQRNAFWKPAHLSRIAWTWVGLIVGVSFLATPAKFLAPSLSLPEALDVGRATFGVFKYFECVLLVSVLLINWLISRSYSLQARVSVIFATLISMLLIQYGWLLPFLDARVEQILQGETPPPSAMHQLYVGFEVGKVACLVALGLSCEEPLSTNTGP